MEINNKLIADCLGELRSQQVKLSLNKRYYEGHHDILDNYKMAEARSNLRVVVNFTKRFIDERVSYVTANPINYVSRSNEREIEDVVNRNIAVNEKLNNQNLLKQAQIYGKAYSLSYLDELGGFKSMTLTPLECYVLDSERIGEGAILGLRVFTPKFSDEEYLDVYDSDFVHHYIVDNANNLNYIDSEAHMMGQVPIIKIKANTEETSLINDIKNLNDAYNGVLSDLVNEVSDFRNSFLKVTNAELTAEEALKMKSSGIIHLSGDKASIEFLTKEINDSFVQNLLQELEEKMFKMVSTVDSNEKMQSNTSSLSIRAKLFLLESICSLIQSELEETIRNKVQMFFNIHAIKTGVQYYQQDLILKFTPNIPNDIASLADSISKLKDLVSQRTLLTLLPFIEDVDLEMIQFKEEQNLLSLSDLDMVNGGD